MSRWMCAAALGLSVALGSSAGRAQSPEEWIRLGERVHGGFGAFIPVGIRIGQDALQRLKAAAARGLRHLLRQRQGAVRLHRRRHHDRADHRPVPSASARVTSRRRQGPRWARSDAPAAIGQCRPLAQTAACRSVAHGADGCRGAPAFGCPSCRHPTSSTMPAGATELGALKAEGCSRSSTLQRRRRSLRQPGSLTVSTNEPIASRHGLPCRNSAARRTAGWADRLRFWATSWPASCA